MKTKKLFKVAISITFLTISIFSISCSKVNTDTSIIKQLDSISGATKHK
ncbi:MAG: hypothetical protein JXR91_04910 [Deltaproteobacteria bacterium]|nr:hypothetical protein [Deltaproteobacteria bacterium]